MGWQTVIDLNCNRVHGLQTGIVDVREFHAGMLDTRSDWKLRHARLMMT